VLGAVDKWKELPPHVEDIEVLYDDGVFQEFWMTVRAVDTGVIKVRSVRKCEEERIRFFQPAPPAFLKEHRGEWTWKPSGQGGNISGHHTRVASQQESFSHLSRQQVQYAGTSRDPIARARPVRARKLEDDVGEK
jgi:hypothetical protein